jgi:hypothetical protein
MDKKGKSGKFLAKDCKRTLQENGRIGFRP